MIMAPPLPGNEIDRSEDRHASSFALLLFASLATARSPLRPLTRPTRPSQRWLDRPHEARGVEEVRPGVDRHRRSEARTRRRTPASRKPRRRSGTIWVNGETGRLPDLITKEAFGDCEVHVEFLIAKNSNAGIKFHAVYEIQILDSSARRRSRPATDMGGIYPRADA